MRSTMEETNAGPFKNTVTGSFKSTSQTKPSTQPLTGLTENLSRRCEKWICSASISAAVSQKLKPVIEKIPEMMQEALLFELIVSTAKQLIDKTLFQPTENSMCSGRWSRLLDGRCVWLEYFSKMIRSDVISQTTCWHDGLKRTVLEGNAFFRSELGRRRNYTEWVMKLFQCWTKSKTKKNYIYFLDNIFLFSISWCLYLNQISKCNHPVQLLDINIGEIVALKKEFSKLLIENTKRKNFFIAVCQSLGQMCRFG